MQRPTKQPDKPMGFQDLYIALNKHFVYDHGKRCTVLPGGGICSYNNIDQSVGCFVGILLTSQDAAMFDSLGGYRINGLMERKDTKKILNKYFDFRDPLVMPFLLSGQIAHDEGDGVEFEVRMGLFFRQWHPVVYYPAIARYNPENDK